MSRMLYKCLALISLCLPMVSCSLIDGRKDMLPEISVDMTLQQFLQLDIYQADDLVKAALNYVQRTIDNRGTVFISDLWLRLECLDGQCLLKSLIVTIAANPLQKPTIILNSDDEFVSIYTDFFFTPGENTVKTMSMRSRWLSATLPTWESLPISLAEAQNAFINYARQNIAQKYSRYRISINLSPQGWTADFYYTDSENTRSPADETLEILFESQP